MVQQSDSHEPYLTQATNLVNQAWLSRIDDFGAMLGALETACAAMKGFSQELENDTFAKLPVPLVKGRQYLSVVEVRKDRISAYLNAKLVCEYRTDFSEISRHDSFYVGAIGLGIGTETSTAVFSKVEITEITDEGKELPRER